MSDLSSILEMECSFAIISVILVRNLLDTIMKCYGSIAKLLSIVSCLLQ